MNIVESFFQNVKDKLTSPFFGTLCLILIVHHWEFWYTLFNFDKDCTRSEKLAILRLIGSNEFTKTNLLCDILWAISITLTGYIVVFGTRTLSLFFDHKAMPWITNKVVDKNVVLKTVYADVENERNEYSEKYEEQRKLVRILSRDFDQQSEQLKDKDKLILEETQKVNKLSNENGKLTTQVNNEKRISDALSNDLKNNDLKISSLEKDNARIESYSAITEKDLFQFKSLFFDDKNKDNWIYVERFPTTIVEKVKEIKRRNLWGGFLQMYNALNYGGSYSHDLMNDMENLGLVNLDHANNITKLTTFGSIIGAYQNVLKTI